eukprot:XP_014774792.1 PREDICTED: CENPB DNA-binding domain-containing protein 1-like [Octopus bimaculoides]
MGTIRENREKIMSSAQEALFFHRSIKMLKMERLLSVWIEDQNRRNVPINMMVIQKGVKGLYDNFQKYNDFFNEKSFVATKGWFEKFKKCMNLHNIKMNAKTAYADTGY